MDSLTLWLAMMCLIFAALAFNFWRDARLWRERAQLWADNAWQLKNHAERLNAECNDLFQAYRDATLENVDRFVNSAGAKEKSDAE